MTNDSDYGLSILETHGVFFQRQKDTLSHPLHLVIQCNRACANLIKSQIFFELKHLHLITTNEEIPMTLKCFYVCHSHH